jgi:hypothetical protein
LPRGKVGTKSTNTPPTSHHSLSKRKKHFLDTTKARLK